MDKVNLTTFPSSKVEALALIYVEKQNSVGCSPEDLVHSYLDAYDRIKREFSAARKDNPGVIKITTD